MKHLLLLFSFLWCIPNGIGQIVEQKIDSLLKANDSLNPKTDTLFAKNMLELSGHYYSFDIPKGIQAAKDGWKSSIHTKDLEREVKTLYMIGAGFFHMGNMDSSLYYSVQSLERSKGLHKMDFLSNIYNLVGTAYQYKSDFNKALEYGYKALGLAHKEGDSLSIAYIKNNIGSLHWEKGDLAQAEEYFTDAYQIFKGHKDSINVISSLVNIYLVDEDFDKYKRLQEAEELSLKVNHIRALPNIYCNLGGFFFADSIDYELSEKYLLLAQKYANETQTEYIKGDIYGNLAKLYTKLGDPDKGLLFGHKAKLKTLELGHIRELSDSYYSLYEAFKLKNNADSSLYYLEHFFEVHDSLYNDELNTLRTDADAKYQTKLKDEQIALNKIEILNQKANRRKLLFGGAILLILILSSFLWYNERQKRKKQEIKNKLEFEQIEKQKYKELDALKNDFFTSITHELRTPLTLINGPIDRLLDDVKEKEKVGLLSIAKNNGEKLLSMINEILDLSKIQHGKIDIDPQWIPLVRVTKKIFLSFESMAYDYRVQLDFESELDEKILGHVDVKHLEIILNNLISNAIKFSEEGGKVTLLLSKSNDAIEIAIKDNGQGISEEDKKFIFDKFYQAKSSQKEIGTGIGLATSHSLAEKLSGSLALESQEGQGSTFSLKLPTSFKIGEDVNKDVLLTQDKFVDYKPLLINGAKPSVLVVDDNEEMRWYIENILEEHFNITTANDGYEAMKVIQKSKFDLISCDVMMPKMDGFTLKSKINEILPNDRTPFIFLSAKIMEEDKIKGFQLGVHDYITKPFNQNEYLARVYNLITNKISRSSELAEIDQVIGTEDKHETALLKKAESYVISNIDDPAMRVQDIADELAYSQRNLARIIKHVTGLSPVKFILEIRLQKAYHLLKKEQFGTIAEVRQAVGIESASYFTKKFRERFGVNPSEFS